MVTAGLVAATAVMLRQLIMVATHAIPGELRDPLLNTWILAWDAARLRDSLRGLWDAPILYPYQSTLAFSEHLLGIAAVSAPIEWINQVDDRVGAGWIGTDRAAFRRRARRAEAALRGAPAQLQ
jgi:hypothetical protein